MSEVIQKQILSEKECADILDNASDNWKNSKVGAFNYESKERISSEQTVYNYGKFVSSIYELKKQLGIQKLPVYYKLVRYKKGDVFKRHRDVGEGYNNRYKTLIIQLSNPDNYKGGDLLIYNNIKDNKAYFKASKQIGSCIMFPANLLHEVTPIEEGIRYSLVLWLTRDQMGDKRSIL
tara:strand:+ start:2254 stop:2787 length:534 start_codon:yes stop_codon:yes gene_type:complete